MHIWKFLDCKYKETAVRNPNYKYDTFILALWRLLTSNQIYADAILCIARWISSTEKVFMKLIHNQ